ncbi:SAM-dependent methyltransferase [Nonomuraea sp. NPDC050536]|uniref:SAM-dependent methyltransferase n=1 Tax=Nonomuraea sp. NPDC050536 TaxID=3364366 RepID=UPI0037CBD27B
MELDRVSQARMYDAAQGGKQNFSADREALRLSEEISTDAGNALIAHHQHVHRVVRHLALTGLDQFVLYGTGLPSTGLAHQSIHAACPTARVVYAEQDTFMLAHAEATVGRTSDLVRIVSCDLAAPADLLDDPMVRTFVDWRQPVVVGLLAVHSIPPDDIGQLTRLRAAMAPGSHLWITALSLDGYGPTVREEVLRSHERLGFTIHFRTSGQVVELFDGLDLLEPGLVWATQWRPDGTEVAMAPECSAWLCGVGRLPAG